MTVGGNQRNAARDARDDCATDPRWLDALLRHVTLRQPVWEPAAGQGQLAAALTAHGLETIQTDIRDGVDFLAASPPRAVGSVVTNPPYRLADEFALRSLSCCGQVALLLSLPRLCGQRRTRALYWPNPPALVILCAQRMVVNGAASQFNHAWVVWDDRADGGTRLAWELTR